MGQIDARGWKFEVSEDPSIVTPVWAAIGGIESFDLNPSDGEASTETTTFASGGVQESQAMQRGAKCSVTGKVKRDGVAPGTPDSGQQAATDLAGLVGEASLGGFRFRYTTDTTWTVWTAWVSRGSNSGGINDKTAFSAMFTRSGAATSVAVV